MRPTIRRVFTVTALAAAVLSPRAAAAEVEEELRYRWHLGGFKGFLARLVVPGAGEAVLRTTAIGGGAFRKELHITSPRSRRGEYWLYGSVVAGPDCGELREAWNEQLFRGRAKKREAEIEGEGVLDIPSCICRIRHDPPARPIATRIWSDGKIYPVEISSPVEGEAVVDGRSIATRTYTVAGLERPDERVWKGRLILVVALDERRTPLEIDLVQPGIAVRLELEEEL